MNAKILVFIIRVEAIICLQLYNFHNCTFKSLVIGVLTNIFTLLNKPEVQSRTPLECQQNLQ